ncbi:MAG: hypothetical protein P4L85_06345 [Paludisphaera borealis]|uniref:hypothetical protein n=1 Tax=Paludisphaera borealis TaxID=1387353 RepID=UPI0028501DD4|nr:hypothetical protein [Paludisphaera borealis]MDR3618953.1 hypothetical protein [Paludisphaera borealis]
MSELEAADEPGPNLATDRDVRELMGMFDAPAFARRGQDMEYALSGLHNRCRLQRAGMLDMVHVRLRQWSRAAVGPDDGNDAFRASIDVLWTLSQAEPPQWAASPAPTRQRRTIARDLVASVERFNDRWLRQVAKHDLQPLNAMIEQYNVYYVIEKECVMSSARLASRFFEPVAPLSIASILADHPLLPVPELAGG